MRGVFWNIITFAEDLQRVKHWFLRDYVFRFFGSEQDILEGQFKGFVSQGFGFYTVSVSSGKVALIDGGVLKASRDGHYIVLFPPRMLFQCSLNVYSSGNVWRVLISAETLNPKRPLNPET